ncbi:MAG TPA: DUF4337 domain-containing protein [Polyangia bacterium]|jgi:hypothetical protein
MTVDPLEVAEARPEPAPRRSLNTWVAVAVALLATFMGICKVKDDNIVQAMQQAQADRVDHWAWYQARNIREEVARSSAAQMRVLALSLAEGSPARARADSEAARLEQTAADQVQKKAALKQQAEGDQAAYDRLNYRDDQFDLADAFLALAIALLAITALTQKRWLFGVALVPTTFGLLMGIAGLGNLRIHPDFLVKLLS